MNKVEALARLDAIEREAAELRRIIEAPEPVEKKPLVQAKDKVGFPVYHYGNGYKACGTWAYSENAFATFVQAEAYAEAFNVLLDLRRQPGSEAAEDGKNQYYVNGEGMVTWTCSAPYKTERICPMFDSQESAEAAIETVGKDRILRMYNTLHGRGYD